MDEQTFRLSHLLFYTQKYLEKAWQCAAPLLGQCVNSKKLEEWKSSSFSLFCHTWISQESMDWKKYVNGFILCTIFISLLMWAVHKTPSNQDILCGAQLPVIPQSSFSPSILVEPLNCVWLYSCSKGRFTSQPPLQLGMAMWPGSGQWDVSRGSVCILQGVPPAHPLLLSKGWVGGESSLTLAGREML